MSRFENACDLVISALSPSGVMLRLSVLVQTDRLPSGILPYIDVDRCIDLEDRGLMTPAGRRAFEKVVP